MLLEVENLQKRYGDIKAVDGISFQVEKGEIFGLLGPNGAGKSTTISMISTLVPQTAGSMLFKGKDISREPGSIRKRLGVVPQDIALYPTLSGYENLVFWGNMYGLRGAELKRRIGAVAEIIGISGRLKDRVDRYSGGMKRRINIGAALLHSPDLLIMDEPTVGIDPQSRSHILDTVLQLNQQGMTIIYTSHYMEEVEYLCSRICIMDQGKIVASGTRSDLVEMAQGKTQVELSLESIDADMAEAMWKIKGIDGVERQDDHIMIQCENADLILGDIVSLITARGNHLNSINVKKPNLETVFLHLTGKALRD